MTVFACKEAFTSLGIEQIKPSRAYSSKDCAICIQPLAVHPSHVKGTHSKLHTAVRIAACGHVVGKKCLDTWLDIGHTCPTCNRMLFEATSNPITQRDINKILRALGPLYGENAVMAVVARLVVRQTEEHARLRQAHELEMRRMKSREMRAANNEYKLSGNDFFDSDEETEFDDEEDDGVFDLQDDDTADSAE